MHSSAPRIANIAELWDLVVGFADCGTVTRLRQVSRFMKTYVDGFNADRYDVDRFLGRFFHAVAVFRQLQATYGATISGSQVLDFLNSYSFTRGSDIDIYLQPGTLHQFGNFMFTEGYVYLGTDWAVDSAAGHYIPPATLYRRDAIAGVYRFARGAQHVDLVVAAETPLHCILNFHSTVVMNGITWDGAFSLFPKATFVKGDGLAFTPRGHHCLAKYKQRGFKLYRERLGRIGQFDDHLATGHRWLGDRHTWHLRFDTRGLIGPPVSNAFWSSSFTVGVTPVAYGRNILCRSEFHIDSASVAHPLLSGRFTACATGARFITSVIRCVRERIAAGDNIAGCSAAIYGTDLTPLHSWDDLYGAATIAWVQNTRLAVVRENSAVFYPLGGTVVRTSRSFSFTA